MTAIYIYRKGTHTCEVAQHRFIYKKTQKYQGSDKGGGVVQMVLVDTKRNA